MDYYQAIEKYRTIVDAYAIDIFVEDYWNRIPEKWRTAFDKMSDRDWSSILNVDAPLRGEFPLSFLCLRQIFVNCVRMRFPVPNPIELTKRLGFQSHEGEYPCITSNQNKRRVKEKKQHEINRLICLLKNAQKIGGKFDFAVDVGAGIGHLSRFLALEFDNVRVITIEADSQLVQTANNIDIKMKSALKQDFVFPHRIECLLDETSNACIAENVTGDHGLMLGLHPCGDLSATILRSFVNYANLKSVVLIGCCYHKLNNGDDKVFKQKWENNDKTFNQHGFPLSQMFASVKLSYTARELACHAVEQFATNLEKHTMFPKCHFYRALVELALWEHFRSADMRHIPVKSVKNADTMQFSEFVEVALSGQKELLKIVEEQVNSNEGIKAILSQSDVYIRRTMFFYYLRLLFAPIVEHILVTDRLKFIEEAGYKAFLIPLFDPVISPRNYVIFGHK